VRTPEAFLELMRTQATGKAAPLKMPLFLARHPEAIATLPGNVASLRPPTSYATCRYFALHAFHFLDAEGGSRYVRYTFVPEREEPRLWPWQARGRGRDYLQEEIRERVASGAIRFALEVQIAAPGDTVDDPTSAWPNDRERVVLGTLELTGLDTERETGDDVLVFDPSRVTDGIELSDDPVLRFRPSAYRDSVSARTGG
jgi:catalase